MICIRKWIFRISFVICWTFRGGLNLQPRLSYARANYITLWIKVLCLPIFPGIMSNCAGPSCTKPGLAHKSCKINISMLPKYTIYFLKYSDTRTTTACFESHGKIVTVRIIEMLQLNCILRAVCVTILNQSSVNAENYDVP